MPLNKNFKREAKNYHTGVDDKLEPLRPLDINEANDFDDMLGAMSKTAFGGRKVGEGVETLYKMFSDKNAFVVLSLARAMTPAKMGLVICEMIDRGFVHAIVSTGALMTHGFVEASGLTHFKYDPKIDDVELFKAGYNRIYDTLELERNLDSIEGIIYKVLDTIDSKIILSSRFLTRELGKWLTQNTTGRGILKSAYLKNVPVYVPAFTDSELGLDVALYNRSRQSLGKRQFDFNPFIDLNHFAELINAQKKTAIITIGGGVPRNWSQQVGPYLELISGRMPKGLAPKHIKGNKYTYALRISPESVHWGGLSGSTYSEAVSWGKFVPKSMGGSHTEVLEDATVVWPMMLKAVIQRIEKHGIKIKKNFDLEKQVKEVGKLMKRYKLDKNLY